MDKVEKVTSREDISFPIKENSKEVLLVKKLVPEASLPQYATPHDMCIDIKAVSVEYEEKTDTYVYHTGVALETDKNVGTFAVLRSSNAKTDCYLCNHIGTLDTADYRGEIIFKFKNRTAFNVRKMLNEWEAIRSAASMDKSNMSEAELLEYLEKFQIPTLDPMDYKPYEVGDKIAQLFVVRLSHAEVIEVDKLKEPEYRMGGFGHTGR